jgi:hypothetical protein
MLPTVKTDLFAVNQMVATWDVQCAYEGQPSGNILQVACSERGNYFKAQYTCVQYPDLCDAAIVAAWWAPAQNEYISLYQTAGTKNKNGGGGFFHQVGLIIHGDCGFYCWHIILHNGCHVLVGYSFVLAR